MSCSIKIPQIVILISLAFVSVAVRGQSTPDQQAQKPNEGAQPAAESGVNTGGAHAPVLDAEHRPITAGGFVKSGPVFSGASDVYGVGHASFTTSPDGSEDWIVYHSKIDPAPGWNRDIRTQKFAWNSDGSPNFGVPVSPGASIAMPAGECK